MSRYNLAQDRIIMLSTTSIYLLTETENKENLGGYRSMPISHLKYIIKSNVQTCKELLMYFADESDFRVVIPNEDNFEEFFDSLNMRFPA